MLLGQRQETIQKSNLQLDNLDLSRLMTFSECAPILMDVEITAFALTTVLMEGGQKRGL